MEIQAGVQEVRTPKLLTPNLAFLAIPPATYIWFRALIHLLGQPTGFWVSMGLYWSILAVLSLALVGPSGVLDLYGSSRSTRWSAVSFLPAIGPFIIVFLPRAARLTPGAAAVVAGAAVVNGVSEELFWPVSLAHILVNAFAFTSRPT